MKHKVRLVEVIVTELEVVGRGTSADPLRTLRQFWSKDGDLLAEVDVLDEDGRCRFTNPLREAL